MRHVADFAVLTTSFDPMGRLSSQEVTDGANRRLQHRAYTYRPDGGLVGITDALSGPRRFDLDGAGRVTAVHARDWTERYAYDETGNQTEASWPATHPSRLRRQAPAPTRAPASPMRDPSATNTTPRAGRSCVRRPGSHAKRTPGATSGTRRTASPR
ncbi:hypothetical protein SNARM312S_01487 [Streptomyces narbonensis]